ncbi:MAG: nicotinamide-nucleotide adenylyltransferase, partial [Nitrososphaeraceae archaeon]|nr:nicotinamide-nucleotide adenylyltransferase [Nitrososphaeraceae archaeon]
MIQRKAHGSTENQRKLTRGLIIGRFQPFHKGHLDLVYQVLEEINELIIVIGSSQHNYIFKDPFTAGERLVMIHDTLVQEKIDLSRIYIVPIPNFENNAAWLAYLQSMLPTFNVVYSGNEFVSILVNDQIAKSRNSKFSLV